MSNTGWEPTIINGKDVKYRVQGIEDYDLDDADNQEQRDAISKLLDDQTVTSGGVNFILNDDMYTVEFKTLNADIWREEE